MYDYAVMTFNLKVDDPFAPPELRFSHRARAIEELIRWNHPDLIGVQELTNAMIPHLEKTAGVYGFYGAARHDSLSDERCCVLYDRSRFTLITEESATFWLSPAPQEPGSRFPGAFYPRIATLAVLKDQNSGQIFTMVNTHLDHLLAGVRARQAEVLAREIKKRARGDFLIVTGDFNDISGSAALKALTSSESGLHLQDLTPSHMSTSRRPVSSLLHREMAIDHILISEPLSMQSCRVLTSLSMGRVPSDHFPVLAEISCP
jgi:endonuclease/exonuclease/phosphatase family metal-dependent hydrolase